MRNPGGYLTVTHEDGRVEEYDTFTCAGCNSVQIIAPGRDPGQFCPITGKMVCLQCAKTKRGPFERYLEQQEAAYHARRSYGI